GDRAVGSASVAPAGGSITVFAAASLTDAFSRLGDEFEATQPGVSVAFNFAGSPAVVTQIEQGAHADVLATADEDTMRRASDGRLLEGEAVTFARNRLAIIVPRSNPGRVSSAADLARPGLKIVLAQKDVPVGRYARQVLENLSADPVYGEGFA